MVTLENNWEPHLRGMLQYAAAASCRRSLLCRHFGEAPAPCHGMCDCCKRHQASGNGAAGAGSSSAAAAAAAGGGRAAAAAAATAEGGTAGQGQKDVTEAAKGALQTLQVQARMRLHAGLRLHRIRECGAMRACSAMLYRWQSL